MSLHLQTIDHVHIYVQDRAAAERWYSRVLGLARSRHLEFWAADGGPLTLQNDTGSIHLALFERPNMPCRSTIALRVAGSAFQAWHAHLEQELPGGVTFEDHQASVSVYFADPDGNPFEVTTYEVGAVVDRPGPASAGRHDNAAIVRPHTAANQQPVTLREITAGTVDAVIKLSVAESQRQFVAPNAVSLAQAIFAPEAWYRAIYSGEVPAGFIMVYDESLRPAPPASPKISVWRFMVAEQHQGKGIGRAALQLVIQHVRRKGCFHKLELSYVPADGSPEPFYLSLGFQNTDRFDEGERIMELPLDAAIKHLE